MPYLLGNQTDKAKGEDNNGQRAVVMFFIAMTQGVNPNGKSQEDHEILKRHIFNDIYA